MNFFTDNLQNCMFQEMNSAKWAFELLFYDSMKQLNNCLLLHWIFELLNKLAGKMLVSLVTNINSSNTEIDMKKKMM